MEDIYFQLVPDETEAKFYEQVPRLGSFEVSINGVLLFSKLNSKMWPNVISMTQKCQQVCEDLKNGIDITRYAAQGNRYNTTSLDNNT